MISFRNLPIQRKVLVVVLVTSASALLVGGAGIVIWDQYLFRARLREDLSAVAQIIADNSTAALAFNDPDTAEQTLSALKAKPNVVAACIYRQDGSIIASYFHGRTRQCPQPASVEEHLIGGEWLLVRPISLADRKIGTLVLRYDLIEVTSRFWLYSVIVLGTLLFSSLLMLLFLSRLRRGLVSPILELVETTNSITRTRNYAVRAHKVSGDELGVLVDAFNEMLENIQTRDAELRRSHDELEQRVEERTEALQRQTEELARSNADLQQFAYVASHDLQEPLRMVISYMQIIEEEYKGKLSEEADEFINFAVDGAKRMRQLISDLLAYSRIGRGEPATLQPIDIQSVLSEVLTNLSVSIQETGAVVEAGQLPTLPADRSQMVQLFQNLIGNALKFRGTERPRIQVSASREGAFWKFCVSDNGIGIDPDYQDRIFVIFQRLHAKTKYPGTGIGLAICKKIVDNLGGRIWVELELGRGSSFYFTIPAGSADHSNLESHVESKSGKNDQHPSYGG